MVNILFRLCAAVFSVLGFSLCAAGQELSLATNIADYAMGGTLNAETSYGISRHWSLNAGFRYNPFRYGEGDDIRLHRQRSFSAGARWWPWHIYSGWWISWKIQYQEYASTDSQGALFPDYFGGGAAMEGDRYGAGVGAGYSRMLGPHFNLDLGLGFWGGYSTYVRYSCPSCGRIVDNGAKPFFLPNELILALNYIF